MRSPKGAVAESRANAEMSNLRELRTGLEVALLTGCQDRHYAFGLAMSLAADGIYVDIIGGDEIDSPEFHVSPNLRFLNLRAGRTVNGSFARKCWNEVAYYASLMGYAASSR